MTIGLLTLLLPPLEVLRRTGEFALIERMLSRGDRQPRGVPGRRAQQARLCDVVPKPPAWAAITRAFDCSDAAGSLWLRADPASLRVEAGGLRLVAFGEDLALTQAESEQLAATIRPLFHELNMVFSAPHSGRWYVQLARGRPTPAFRDPESALGTLDTPLPPGTTGSAEWMRLLNDAQMALHDHLVNRLRTDRGLAPVNSLWLWGAGETPLKVAMSALALWSADSELRALAKAAGMLHEPDLPRLLHTQHSDAVVDARGAARREAIDGVLSAQAEGKVAVLRIDSEDGTVVEFRRWHRLRFWR